MPDEIKSILALSALLVVLLFVLVVIVIGLINPFLCDVAVVNLISCIRDRAQEEEIVTSERQQPEGQIPTEEIPLEETTVITPTPSYQDLEEALSEDPGLELFVQSLKRAIEQADFETLESLIPDPFNIGQYQSDYHKHSRPEAIEYFQRWLEPEKVSVDITNEGRKVALEFFVTPRKGAFALLSTGWPDKAILGVGKIGEQYFWTDLIREVP